MNVVVIAKDNIKRIMSEYNQPLCSFNKTLFSLADKYIEFVPEDDLEGNKEMLPVSFYSSIRTDDDRVIVTQKTGNFLHRISEFKVPASLNLYKCAMLSSKTSVESSTTVTPINVLRTFFYPVGAILLKSYHMCIYSHVIVDCKSVNKKSIIPTAGYLFVSIPSVIPKTEVDSELLKTLTIVKR